MIQLTFTMMWCGEHLEPFREGWPKSAALAMFNLFAASAADERILAACDGVADRLEPVLREHGPMCCFLPTEVTEAVVRASLDGQKWAPDDPAVTA